MLNLLITHGALHTYLKIRASIFLLMMCAMLFTCHVNAAPENPNLKWYTEDYPPFNYQKANELNGIALNILKKAYAELEWQLNTQDISIMPWARAYYTLKNEPNACLFSMTYTTERTKDFNFVGTVMPNTVAIIGRSDSVIDEMQLKTDFNLRFGVVKNDIGHQTLMEYGIPSFQFVYLKTGFELVQMLEHKRIDLIAYGDVIARYQFKRANLSQSQFKVIKPLLNSFLGYACNKHVPDDVIDTLNSTIHRIVKAHPEIVQY
jgi:ABC-type amino acid transport substrate-binding protein